MQVCLQFGVAFDGEAGEVRRIAVLSNDVDGLSVLVEAAASGASKELARNSALDPELGIGGGILCRSGWYHPAKVSCRVPTRRTYFLKVIL